MQNDQAERYLYWQVIAMFTGLSSIVDRQSRSLTKSLYNAF